FALPNCPYLLRDSAYTSRTLPEIRTRVSVQARGSTPLVEDSAPKTPRQRVRRVHTVRSATSIPALVIPQQVLSVELLNRPPAEELGLSAMDRGAVRVERGQTSRAERP